MTSDEHPRPPGRRGRERGGWGSGSEPGAPRGEVLPSPRGPGGGPALPARLPGAAPRRGGAKGGASRRGGPPQPPADPRPALGSPQPRAAPGARASQQPRRRQHHSRHLESPPTDSVVTSCSASGAPAPRRRPKAFRLALPVRGAEAAARGLEQRPSGGRRGWPTWSAVGAKSEPWSRSCLARESWRRGAPSDGGLRAPPRRHPVVPAPEPRHSGR